MKAACGFLFVVCLSFGCGTQMKLVSSKPPEFPPTGEAPLSIHSYGEFRLAGYHAWTNGMTLKDGIAVAGGLTDFAGRRIKLRHLDGSEECYRLGRNMRITVNPELKAGDLIISPRK